jgi:DNA replication protein DnaC
MKEVLEHLNKLKMTGLRESLDYRLKEALKSNLSYQEFLSLVLEDEVLYRSNRRSEILKRRAKFKDQATLESFEADPKRGVSRSMVKQLQTLHFMASFENIVLFGNTGAGKSYLAQAIGHAACHSGREAFFIPMNYLFSQIKAAEKAGTYLSYLKRLGQIPLLILDDFGLRSYTHHEATLLYQILEDRYQRGSTIITTQTKPQGWKDLFEDPVIAESIIDRILPCSHQIEFKSTADSYRGNHKPKKPLVEIDVRKA